MSHVSYREKGERTELESDYVVVGSGAGGATAAVTLARGGARVAIVEAGPWRDPSDYASSVYGAMRDMLDAWGSNVTRGRAFWPIVQASLVGGTTVINSAIGVRTPADIFEQWNREHGVGGGWMAEAVWRAHSRSAPRARQASRATIRSAT
jgi:choline dehydrogenase-like flavoprotein